MSDKVCKDCGAQLNGGDNWYASCESQNRLYCKSCIKARVKKYRDLNKEEISHRNKARHLKNHDLILERGRIYYQNNRDRYLEYFKKRYSEKKSEIDESHKRWFKRFKENSPEKYSQQRHETYLRRREKHLKYGAEYKAAARSAKISAYLAYRRERTLIKQLLVITA